MHFEEATDLARIVAETETTERDQDGHEEGPHGEERYLGLIVEWAFLRFNVGSIPSRSE